MIRAALAQARIEARRLAVELEQVRRRVRFEIHDGLTRLRGTVSAAVL